MIVSTLMSDTGQFLIDSQFGEHLNMTQTRYAEALATGNSRIVCETSLHLAQVYNAFGDMTLSVKWAEEYSRCSGHSLFYPYWKKDTALLN